MRARRLRLMIAPLIAAAALAGGCSLLVDLGGLDGEDPLTPAEDASSDIPDLVDATRIDAQADAADAGHDAACPADAFCDDFSRDDVQGAWSDVESENGGQLTIEDVGGNPMLRSRAMPTDAGVPRARLVKKLVYFPTTRLRYSFRLEVRKRPASPTSLASFDLGPANDYLTIILRLNAGNPTLNEQRFRPDSGATNLREYALAEPIPVDVSKRVAVELRVGTPWHMTVTVDDKLALDTDLATSPVVGEAIGGIGIGYTNSPSEIDALIDDVVILSE